MLRGYILAYCACFSTTCWQTRKENGPFLDSQNKGKSQGFCSTYHISDHDFADLRLWVLSIALPVGNNGDSVLDADMLGREAPLPSQLTFLQFVPELECQNWNQTGRLNEHIHALETWWHNPTCRDINAVTRSRDSSLLCQPTCSNFGPIKMF